MWPSLTKSCLLLSSLATLLAPASAETLLQSTSLNSCQENSGLTASKFNVIYTPDNGTLKIDALAMSSVEGKVEFDASIRAYGYEIMKLRINPCETPGFTGMCPMNSGKMEMKFTHQLDASTASQIPYIAYTFPDIDAKVKVFINLTEGADAGKSVACVEADVSNGKTVDLLGVKWATAAVAGLSLASSAVINGLGHSNAASHVAANALSLFGYFQAQAMVGLAGIPLPPVVKSWTQDFQWTMGIIRVQFMQDIFTWYQRATGGTPATLLYTLGQNKVSVQVQKRSLDGLAAVSNLWDRAAASMPAPVAPASNAVGHLAKRSNVMNEAGGYIVFGIQRAAFRAGIETTNLFLTGLVFFCIFAVLVSLGVAAFKGFCEVAAKRRWIKPDTFLDFRNGWLTVLKGILFRVALIGFPQIVILCMWEFTQVDSPALVVLAVFFLFGLIITLGWAAVKVIRIARRSVAMHRNPAYILFSDPQALNKWGFLYVQFRASAYYFIVPFLCYILIKAMFVAFSQHNGVVQAVAFIIIEAAALIGASVLRPWMDKSTNSFNIAICVMNFFNAIFLLIFTNVFGQPPIVTGVVGVVLWIANAAFSLVLLIMLIVTTVIVLFRKNPDTRYQAMADDRASFMKSQTQLTTTTELDALAATARGDKGGYHKGGLDLDDDAESISSDSLRRRQDPAGVPLPPSTANSMSQTSYREPPKSPVDPSVPLFPAAGRSPAQFNGGSMNRSQSPYHSNGSTSNLSTGAYRQQHNASPASGYRTQTGPSPWQRGAGYD